MCAVVEVSTECSSLTDRGAVLTNKATCWITPTPEIQLFTVNEKGIKQSAQQLLQGLPKCGRQPNRFSGGKLSANGQWHQAWSQWMNRESSEEYEC